MTSLDVLRSLYAVSGTALVLAYVPQVVAVCRCREGAPGVSLLTWGAWSAAATISFLYACLVLGDRGASLVAFGSALGCYAVTAAAVVQRARHRRAARSAPPPGGRAARIANFFAGGVKASRQLALAARRAGGASRQSRPAR